MSPTLHKIFHTEAKSVALIVAVFTSRSDHHKSDMCGVSKMSIILVGRNIRLPSTALLGGRFARLALSCSHSNSNIRSLKSYVNSNTRYWRILEITFQLVLH